MDHIDRGPGPDRRRVRVARDWARVTRRHAGCKPGQKLRSSSSSPTAGRRSARCRRCATRSAAALAGGHAHRLGGAARRPARVPRRLLGARRRRGRGRRRAPAGRALRAVPRPAGRRPRRAAADPGQGPDRPRLRRPRFWDTETFVLPVLTYTAPDGRGRRAALAAHHARPGPRAGPAARPARARRSRGARSAGRSARATGRPARPRSTSTPTSPTPSCRYLDATGDEAFERDVRPRAAGGDGAAVALARPPRPRRRVPDRRRHRARRVHRRSPTTTCTRTSWRSGTCAPRPTSARRHAERGARGSASTTEEIAAWRDAAAAMHRDPVRRASSASTRRPRASPSTSAGTSRRRRPTSTRCCCTSRTSTSTASRWSSRPTWCWRMHLRGDAFTAEQKARNFAYYERADGPRLVAVGVHPGGRSPPRSATSTSPTTTSPRPR